MPVEISRSASSAELMRLEAMTGTSTTVLSRAVRSANAALGTDVTTVGTRASCHPIPVLNESTPAASRRAASSAVSSHVWPPSTRSSRLIRYCSRKSGPTASRVRRTISSGNRIRFDAVPPHASVRSLVRSARNWLIRYPSEPMISMPSYPARRASRAARTHASMVRSTPRADRPRARNGLMGDLVVDAERAIGW